MRMSLRFIATADWQLGMAANYLDAQARPRYQQARFDAIKKIGELANQEQAQFIVVAGDVFEHNQLDRSVLGRTFEALRSCKVPIYLLPGNHDPLDAASIYDSAEFKRECPDNVHVIRDSQPINVQEGAGTQTLGRTVAQIVGAPWFSKKPTQDLVEQALQGIKDQTGDAKEVPRILVGHGSVDTMKPGELEATTIRSGPLQEAISSGSVDIAIIGDHHNTVEILERVWSPGAPEVTSRVENDVGNVLLIELDDNGTSAGGKLPKVTSIPVGSWEFQVKEAQVNNDEDLENLFEELRQVENKDRVALWLKLAGTLTTAQMASLDERLEQFGEIFALLQLWERHNNLVLLPDSESLQELGLRGYAHEAAEELQDLATVNTEEGPNESARVAQDALRLLYRFVKQEEK